MDTFAVAGNAAVHTAAADTVFRIVVCSSVAARNTAAPGIAGTVAAVGLVGACLHPCKYGPLLWTV